MYTSAITVFTHSYTADGALWRVRLRMTTVQFADDYQIWPLTSDLENLYSNTNLYDGRIDGRTGEWVSSFLTVHQHIIGYFSALQWCDRVYPLFFLNSATFFVSFRCHHAASPWRVSPGPVPSVTPLLIAMTRPRGQVAQAASSQIASAVYTDRNRWAWLERTTWARCCCLWHRDAWHGVRVNDVAPVSATVANIRYIQGGPKTGSFSIVSNSGTWRLSFQQFIFYTRAIKLIATRQKWEVCTRVKVVFQIIIIILFRAGSSMRLVRLKPQGPGPNRGPDRPVQWKCTSMTTLGPEISREKIC